MFVWDEVVGKQEKRMLKLPKERAIAFAAVCADHALAQIEPFLDKQVPGKALATVKDSIKALWGHTAATGKKSPVTQKRIAELHALYPDEDDMDVPAGWADMVSAVTLACEMANGDSIKESMLDCVGYAYQSVMGVAVKTQGARGKRTESSIRMLEKKSALCRGEMEFQLAGLAALESGVKVASTLFPVKYP